VRRADKIDKDHFAAKMSLVETAADELLSAGCYLKSAVATPEKSFWGID
jgi:hypothetical protein